MYSLAPKFAESSSSGISSLGINLKAFIFQLLTFLIVMLILGKFVYPKLVATLEARRRTLEEGLAQAKASEEALAKAEERAEEILAKARATADTSIAEAKQTAETVIASAEDAAAERAKLIVQEAEAHLEQERAKLREQLRGELADLVATATEKIVREKLTSEKDKSLIKRAVAEVAR